MHYDHFKQRDPKVLKGTYRVISLGITVNGPNGPVVAHAPLTFKQGITANGMVEFHLC